MSEFFDELMTGLNEAITIVRGDLREFNNKNEVAQDIPVEIINHAVNRNLLNM